MVLASRHPIGPRSSLLSHSFPSFYACYLLKSIQTPQSKATYIGSTPSPPRRIRQHNGEIAQGAWKTKQKRPWVMQMIVHGFPSRLAALQFEWAWQHPHISRHLRDERGNPLFTRARSMYLKMNIQAARMMLSTRPYNIWPLHVKLFTDEAAKAWDNATKNTAWLSLPPGFTCSVELEGVDGKSGHIGSGRRGPISVKDEEFTSAYLAKNTGLMATNRPLRCSICSKLLANFTTDALSTTLCPAPSCVAVSHLTCLSENFLASQTVETGLIPRGGTCASCHTYVLWGDVVRGCYRRKTGGAVCEPEEGDVLEHHSSVDVEQGTTESQLPRKKVTVRKADGSTQKAKKNRQKEHSVGAVGRDGEPPDVGSTSGRGAPNALPRQRGRPRKALLSAKPVVRKGRKHHIISMARDASSEGENFSLDISSTDEGDEANPLPKKRGRPRKTLPSTEHMLGSAGPFVFMKKQKKVAASTRPKDTKRKHHTSASPLSSDESGELFDFGTISDSEGGDDITTLASSPRRGRAGAGGVRGTKLSIPYNRVTSNIRRVDPDRPRHVKTTSTSVLYPSSTELWRNDIRRNESTENLPAPKESGSHSVHSHVGVDSGGIEFGEELGLMRAMSTLSVSSPATSPGIDVSE